ARVLQDAPASLQHDRVVVDDEHAGHGRLLTGVTRSTYASCATHWDHDLHAGAAAAGALDRIMAAERLHAFLHAGNAEADRGAGIDAETIVAHRELQVPGGVPLRPRVGGDCLAEIDADVLGLGVADRVGQAFLDAAVDREVDRVAIAALERRGLERKYDLRVLLRALAHQLGQDVLQGDVAERHRAQ